MNDVPLIITLTSIPSRFSRLGPTLKSLLRQHIPAAEIRLHIPYRYRRFPEWDGVIPAVPQGVTIVRTQADYGPSTKILPAVRSFRGKVVDLLLCDDDRIYDQHWTTRFMESRRLRPGCVIAEDGAGIPGFSAQAEPRAQRTVKGLSYRFLRAATMGTCRPPKWRTSGYVDIFKGYGGALVRPDFFPEFAFDIPDVLWTVDDIWLSGCVASNGVGIWINANSPMSIERRVAHQDALLTFRERGLGRKEANTACWEWFQTNRGIWSDPLRDEPPSCSLMD